MVSYLHSSTFWHHVVSVFSNGTKDLCRRGSIEHTTKPHVKSVGRIRLQCIADLTYIWHTITMTISYRQLSLLQSVAFILVLELNSHLIIIIECLKCILCAQLGGLVTNMFKYVSTNTGMSPRSITTPSRKIMQQPITGLLTVIYSQHSSKIIQLFILK